MSVYRWNRPAELRYIPLVMWRNLGRTWRYTYGAVFRETRILRAYPSLYGGERVRILRNLATARTYAIMLGPYPE